MKRLMTIVAASALLVAGAAEAKTPGKNLTERRRIAALLLHQIELNYQFGASDSHGPGAVLESRHAPPSEVAQLAKRFVASNLRALRKVPIRDKVEMPSLYDPAEKGKWKTWTLSLGTVAGVRYGTHHIAIRKADDAIEWLGANP